MNTAIEVAAKRGKTRTSQTERAQVAAKGRQAETEAAPIRYVAE
jgi:hypothetical protein